MVYLLHFDKPYHHAQHYLGFADDVPARLQRHLEGRGSPLVKAAVAAGITVTIAKTWEGTRILERKLKNRKNARKLCPCCR